MKRLSIKSAAIVAVTAVLSLSAVGAAQADNSCNPAYRNYYLDQNCRYYYIDANGNKVTGGSYVSGPRLGMVLHKDCCSNRWYYLDAWGTKVFVSNRCA